ncbi:Predicted N-formylglutamate amidohydrolase [Palleronia salina]|uniref:Predicted N-formylglutamate amidohydrolase n=1 Tax=Palleronia salina TaxID=313368 RepID=A0A1M6KT54_9RHOB|nr:N-formylglutamate amidohydrolase [Palleronia salina]SHJ62138.1 Predicted N-formylglutamate amidohydrolase [Palleronia salina]
MDDDWQTVEVIGAGRGAPLVVVCEHAASHIPASLDGLGLDAAARASHAAWDIGALDVAAPLARALDAPLVAARISRLVYDLNRPLEAASAIPDRSEVFDVPGNRGLDAAARQERHDRVAQPFHDRLAEVMAAQERQAGTPVTLLTIHSFTPVFDGQPRAVELGFLHNADGNLARCACAIEAARGTYDARVNEPYGPADGVGHMLKVHGDDHGRPALMLEIRNDLIDTPDRAAAMADHLLPMLRQALAGPDAKAAE